MVTEHVNTAQYHQLVTGCRSGPVFTGPSVTLHSRLTHNKFKVINELKSNSKLSIQFSWQQNCLLSGRLTCWSAGNDVYIYLMDPMWCKASSGHPTMYMLSLSMYLNMASSQVEWRTTSIMKHIVLNKSRWSYSKAIRSNTWISICFHMFYNTLGLNGSIHLHDFIF